MTDDLFQRAKDQVAVADVAGVKLFRVGQRLRGECPLCGASKGKKGGGAFWVDAVKGKWGCFSCRPDRKDVGDVIDLEQAMGGGSRREAAERLVGPGAAPRKPRERAPAGPSVPDDSAAKAAAMAARLWNEAVPAAGTLVQRYLESRGIVGRVLDAALHRLRFHPRAFWGGEPGAWKFAPAMVVAVHTPSGATGGVHATYLRADGLGKAALEPAKRMWGPQMDAEGRPGAAWLIGPKGSGVLINGEGIESSLSAAILHGEPCRVTAALSLNRLQGGWARDKWGRVDPDCVTPDPETPAFTWPLAGLDVPAVLNAVDRDMKPIRVKARKSSGGTYQRDLTSDERARICGALAERAWARANPQMAPSAFRTVGPGPGMDFNTQLMGRA